VKFLGLLRMMFGLVHPTSQNALWASHRPVVFLKYTDVKINFNHLPNSNMKYAKCQLEFFHTYIYSVPRTNQVRGPYCKLQIHLIFSPSIYGPCAIRAGHESKEKTMRIRKLQYGPRRRGYQDICYISTVCLTGSGTILLTRNGFKFLTQVESKTGQFEIVLKSFARFNTQLKIKES